MRHLRVLQIIHGLWILDRDLQLHQPSLNFAPVFCIFFVLILLAIHDHINLMPGILLIFRRRTTCRAYWRQLTHDFVHLGGLWLILISWVNMFTPIASSILYLLLLVIKISILWAARLTIEIRLILHLFILNDFLAIACLLFFTERILSQYLVKFMRFLHLLRRKRSMFTGGAMNLYVMLVLIGEGLGQLFFLLWLKRLRSRLLAAFRFSQFLQKLSMDYVPALKHRRLSTKLHVYDVNLSFGHLHRLPRAILQVIWLWLLICSCLRTAIVSHELLKID